MGLINDITPNGITTITLTLTNDAKKLLEKGIPLNLSRTYVVLGDRCINYKVTATPEYTTNVKGENSEITVMKTGI